MEAVSPLPPVKTYQRSPVERFIRRIPLYALVLFACFLTLFPIYWMVVSAIQPVKYSFSYPPPLFPQEINQQLLTNMFTKFPIWNWLGNTILLAGMTTIICTILTVLGAYILSAQKWRGKIFFGFLLLVTQLLPEALIVIPLFAIYQKFGLRESLPALAFLDAAFVIPIGTWI